MDHRALEAELAHAALELLRRGFRIRRRQRRKAGKASGILLDGLVQAVIGIAGHGDRDVAAEGLRARRAERQHLHVDAGGVHVRQALGAEIGVLRDDVVAELLAAALQVEIAEFVGADLLPVQRRDEVLLDGDDFHCAYLLRFTH